MSRGFVRTALIVVAFVIVATGVGGYWYLSQSSKSPAPAANSETVNWKTYRDTTYGFEMQYPPTWKLEDTSLSFVAKNGRAASLSIVNGLPFDTETALREDVYIGSESGSEWAAILCEQTNPCYAFLQYHNNSSDSRGFSFSLVIDEVDSDLDRSPGASYDPRTIYPEDIATVRKVLSTLKFTR